MRSGTRRPKSLRRNTPLSARTSPLFGGPSLTSPPIQRQQKELNNDVHPGSGVNFNFGSVPVPSPAATKPVQPNITTSANPVGKKRPLQSRSLGKTSGVGPTDPVKKQIDTDKESSASDEAVEANLSEDEAVEVNKAEDEVEAEPVAPPTISHETKFAAPDGSAKTRKKVAVGEKVTFTGSAAGKWTASSGTPDKLANGTKFEWTAPNRAANPSIKLEVGDKSASVTIEVVEPASITATKDSEIAYTAGQQGAGMYLTFIYHPKMVSFGNIKVKEVSHPASNIEGYYKHHGMPHYHNTGDTFTTIGEDNKDTATDEASQSGYPSPWSDGKFDWEVPNNFKVKTEGGDGKKFTTVTQSFKIEGPSGKTIITKAGEKVERTP